MSITFIIEAKEILKFKVIFGLKDNSLSKPEFVFKI